MTNSAGASSNLGVGVAGNTPSLAQLTASLGVGGNGGGGVPTSTFGTNSGGIPSSVHSSATRVAAAPEPQLSFDMSSFPALTGSSSEAVNREPAEINLAGDDFPALGGSPASGRRRVNSAQPKPTCMLNSHDNKLP
jgi:hypothetical protein